MKVELAILIGCIALGIAAFICGRDYQRAETNERHEAIELRRCFERYTSPNWN